MPTTLPSGQKSGVRIAACRIRAFDGADSLFLLRAEGLVMSNPRNFDNQSIYSGRGYALRDRYGFVLGGY